jgi:hypothetical protein
VHGVPDEGVAEARPSRPDLVEQPHHEQRFQVLERLVEREPAGRRDDGDVELPARDRRRPGDPGDLGLDLREPLAHDVPHAGRDRRPRRGAGLGDHALGDEQADQLGDEERVAVGARDDLVGHLAAHGDAVADGDPVADVRGVQAGQVDAVHPEPGEQRQGLGQQGPHLGGGVAGGEHEQQGHPVELGREPAQQAQAGGVGPVQVVEGQHGRSGPCERLQQGVGLAEARGGGVGLPDVEHVGPAGELADGPRPGPQRRVPLGLPHPRARCGSRTARRPRRRRR